MFASIPSAIIVPHSAVLLLALWLVHANAATIQVDCHRLALPRECQCQRTRHGPSPVINETRLRCRHLTEVTNEHRWTSAPYDRLAFETPHDNLTLHEAVFASMIVRTLRFNVEHLFVHDRTFANTYIGQLAISHPYSYGTVTFRSNSRLTFAGATITNIYFKSMNFQRPLSELIFSQARIYSLLIQSSQFFGFTNEQPAGSDAVSTSHRTHFLDYDLLPDFNRTIAPNSSDEVTASNPSDHVVVLNISTVHQPMIVSMLTILASIDTENLTANVFPNNFDCRHLDEVQLSDNRIRSLDARAFRHLQFFRGRLILRNNRIEHVHPDAFVDLVRLRNLSLANNLIHDLAGEHWRACGQLCELDLSFNRLYQLKNGTFASLQELRVLYLNFNPLELIQADAFANLTHLKEIHFYGANFLHVDGQQHFDWIWALANRYASQRWNAK